MRMKFASLVVLFGIVVFVVVSEGKKWEMHIRMPTDKGEDGEEGTRWAVLVAGSQGFGNYRHQSDVCHAYQLLKKGGLKDENIIVFMYDDIANNELNPRRGTIINSPKGEDVYAGVPKDYTGEQVTAQNFYAVLLGDKSSVKGGSGKVVASRPNDRIFLYYSDHGGPGVLGMPVSAHVYAKDFIDVLKKKHVLKSYKEMVIYIEACESGSIFEGMMPEDLDIYVTTASNAVESSWGTYCPGEVPGPPAEGKPKKKHEILKEITETMKHRIHIDGSVELIGKLLFGPINGPSVLSSKRRSGMPLVDDWDCLKTMVRVFEKECGVLTQYGMKHMRAFANICNQKIAQPEMEETCVAACSGHNFGQWHPSFHGYSA